MTRTAIARLAAALVATTVASGALMTPAAAGGSISLNISAHDADSDRALRTGLQLYSIYNSVRGGAAVRQNGRNNAAGIGQNGRDNFGVVHQEGDGHNGTLQQNGNRNAYGLFQFGRNTESHVVQNGRGGAGATFQFGW